MNPTSNSFAGTERRQHTVFVTRNTEYHVRRGLVIAVRRRGHLAWSRVHAALRMKVDGHVEQDGLVPVPGQPVPGQRLFLGDHDKSVVTSTVIAIERPAKEIAEQYPAEDAAPE